jgi:hypothetical protein
MLREMVRISNNTSKARSKIASRIAIRSESKEIPFVYAAREYPRSEELQAVLTSLANMTRPFGPEYLLEGYRVTLRRLNGTWHRR